MARRILTIILYAGGLATLVIVAAHLVLGSASIPGAGPVSATVDSEDRFYAVIFAGYGLAQLHAARNVTGNARLISFLAGLFLAGAFARIASWALVGRPHPFFLAMLALEILLPLLIWALQAKAARDKSSSGDLEPGIPDRALDPIAWAPPSVGASQSVPGHQLNRRSWR